MNVGRQMSAGVSLAATSLPYRSNKNSPKVFSSGLPSCIIFLFFPAYTNRFLIHLRACRDGRIHHQEMESFLVAFLVNGTDQHAAGIDAQHGSRRKIGDGDTGLSDQFFGLVISVNTA
jgi:hypothetical protein